MKNAFKFGFLAMAISLTVAACGDTETKDKGTDSTTVDTALTTDSAVLDTNSIDSTTTDTTKAVPVK